MSKELIVSATSLETKVAVVEEDQVTEIFIERTKSRTRRYRTLRIPESVAARVHRRLTNPLTMPIR